MIKLGSLKVPMPDIPNIVVMQIIASKIPDSSKVLVSCYVDPVLMWPL